MNRCALVLSMLFAAVLLGGCPETARCPDGQIREGRRCVAVDAGADTGVADGGGADAEPDGGDCGECGAGAPYCVEVGGIPTCSECDPGAGDDHCADSAERPLCDPETARCVACTRDEHCTDPAASRCSDANECVPCLDSGQCAHVMTETGTRLRICDTSADTGRCVGCTVANETTECPGSSVCDPDTQLCVLDARRGSRRTCETCISDSHCAAGHFCVPMVYGEEWRAQRYCLQPVTSGCEPPYMSRAEARESASGAPEDDYCAPNEVITTCEAVLAALEGRECAGTDDATPCEGAGASYCGPIETHANGCTYRCTADNQCPVLGLGSHCALAVGTNPRLCQ